MHLYAIGIYAPLYEDNREAKKIKVVQKSKSSFFNTDDLKELETSSFPKLNQSFRNNVVYGFESKNEHHYFLQSSTREGERLFAICSRTQLDEKELSGLFKNIIRAYQEPKGDLTLENILDNPLGYLKARDPKLDQIQESLDDIKLVMHKNFDLVIQRGERLESLKEKAIKLEADAKGFEKKSKDLNRCCRSW